MLKALICFVKVLLKSWWAAIRLYWTQPDDSPFLKKGHAPVQVEWTSDDLKVKGTIPKSLRGIFIRNGPNPQFTPEADYMWFDGDGMLHAVHFLENGVRYVNRFVRTTKYNTEKKMGKAFFYGLKQLSNLALVLYHIVLRSKLGLSYRFPKVRDGTANTAVEYHAGKLMALHEASFPYIIRAPELETVGRYDFGGALTHNMTAHPKVDLKTGEMIMFGYRFDAAPYVHHSVVDRDGKIVRTVPITIDMPVMMHDFAITEHYSIFMVLPMTFDLKRLVKDEPLLMFETKRGSKFGILPRHATSESEMKWFSSPSCWVFHTMNAYEDGDDVVLYACRSTLSDSATLAGLDIEGEPREEDRKPHLYRWRFNMKTGAVREEYVDSVRDVEFPRVNDSYLGRKFTYGYCGLMRRPDRQSPVQVQGVVKFNVQTGEAQQYVYGDEKYGGEMCFVPNTDQESEDDGYLLGYMTDERTMDSFMVIFDARNVAAGPVASIELPARVPYGFHGKFFTQAEIDAQH